MKGGQIEWQLEDDGATLRCGPLAGRAEADSRGVRFLIDTWNGEPSGAFGALITAGPGPRPAELEVAERYIRGQDFVVRYTKTADYPLTPLYYWRASWHEALSAAQIEMIFSVQTELLDSRPEATIHSVAVESRLFSADRLDEGSFQEILGAELPVTMDGGRSAEHLFVFRHEPLALSYAQMVHPSDFVAAEIHAPQANRLVVTSTLFPERLERGVIRRARICGWFLPAADDLAAAIRLANRFVAEPLPLTA